MSMFSSQQPSEVAQARALLSKGDAERVVSLLTPALERDPDNVHALLLLAEAQLRTAGHLEARENLEKAARLQPDNASILTMLSRTYTSEGRTDKAIEMLDRALAIDPARNETRRAKADLHRLLGEHDKAYTVLRSPVESGDANIYEMLSFALVAHRFEGIDRSIDLAREVLSYEGIAPHLLWQAGFMLGSFLDKAERYDEAFEAYAQANRLRRKPFDVSRQIDRFESIKRAWTRDTSSSIPDSRNPTELPVFVIGMPRSGTTLAERIIGAHPQAHPGGERHEIVDVAKRMNEDYPDFMIDPTGLERADFAGEAEAVLDSMRRDAPDATRIVDKAPTNTIRLNLIAKLFPNAKIIRMRRDPRDTCLSCYFHPFTGAHPYCYDLRDLGLFYPAYEALADHYTEALDLDVLTVPYEELVHDQEAWSRRIIEHIGLEWHEDCLRFHEQSGAAVTSSNEQVREKIYTSAVGRWKHYERHLGPLLEALDESAAS